MARVMVVDDDLDIQEALAQILEAEGHQVTTAGDGRTALGLLKRHPPDVIVLDLMMPSMNGWEFREAQLKDPRLARIPVIVISAATLREPIDAEEFLPKPFEPSQLLELVARHSKRS
jgi:CheY-like chemotaxis protein